MRIEAGIEFRRHKVRSSALGVDIDRAKGKNPLVPLVCTLGDNAVALNRVPLLSHYGPATERDD